MLLTLVGNSLIFNDFISRNKLLISEMADGMNEIVSRS